MSFPISPSNNDTTTVNGITYQYNSTFEAWKIVPGNSLTIDEFARSTGNASFTKANTAQTDSIAFSFLTAGM